MSDELLSLDAVAAKLKVSREQARKLCAAGKLPWVAVGLGQQKKARRVLSSTLEAYMRQEQRDAIGQHMRNIRQTHAAMSGVEERW